MQQHLLPRLRKGVHAVCAWYATVMLVCMLAVVMLQVILRNSIGFPMPWAEEVSVYMQVSLALFGSAFVMIEKGQLYVDSFVDRFPVKFKALANITTLSIQLVFIGLVVYFSKESLMHASRVQIISLGISLIWAYLAIPVTFAFMFLETLLQLIEALAALFSKKTGGDA